MKLTLGVILILSSIFTYGQESFKKSYKIYESVILKGNDTVHLKKEENIVFKDLSQAEKDSIRNIYIEGAKINYTIEKEISGQKIVVSEFRIIDSTFYKEQSVKKVTLVELASKTRGYVKFDGNKLYVNPYLKKDEKDKFSEREIYYYKLKNRQTIKLNFTEWTLSALTIPIKYRLKNDDKGISEEFNTSFNVNIFVGRTFFGKTSFFHRNKVGNISNTLKWTGGLFFGSSTIKLNNSNTSNATNPIPVGIEYTEGIVSLGIGLTFAYNKINLGAFYGWDYSIGENSDKWNYNNNPWVGIAIGYSLFNF